MESQNCLKITIFWSLRLYGMGLHSHFEYYHCYFFFHERHAAHFEQCFFYTSYMYSYKTEIICRRASVLSHHAVLIALSCLWSKWWAILYCQVRSMSHWIILFIFNLSKLRIWFCDPKPKLLEYLVFFWIVTLTCIQSSKLTISKSLKNFFWTFKSYMLHVKYLK